MTEALWLTAGITIGFLLVQPRMRTMRELAQTDTLTGVYNRALLNKTLGRLLGGAARRKEELSILMVDLNDFKQVNDQYGHQFGDLVLRKSAMEMVKVLRRSDFIFRYGGDEFMIILPGTSSTGGKLVTRKIQSKLGRLKLSVPGGRYQSVSAAIGVATYPQDAKNDRDLISRADQASYEAKSGRRTTATL